MTDPVRTLTAHEKYGLPLCFDAGGTALVTGGFDGGLARWDTDTWGDLGELAAHDNSVNCGALASDGRVVTGSTDTTVRIHEADLSATVETLTGHAKTVAGMAAHSRAPTVASASYDATVRLWEPGASSPPVVLEGHPNNVTCVAFVGDGDRVASGGLGEDVIVWDVAEATELARLGGHGQAVAGLAASGTDDVWSVGHAGTVTLWSVRDRAPVRSFDLPEDATPSGLAVAPGGDAVAVTRDGGVVVSDAEGDVLAEHETSIRGIYAPRWSPDGAILAVGGADGGVRIYDRPADA